MLFLAGRRSSKDGRLPFIHRLEGGLEKENESTQSKKKMFSLIHSGIDRNLIIIFKKKKKKVIKRNFFFSDFLSQSSCRLGRLQFIQLSDSLYTTHFFFFRRVNTILVRGATNLSIA